MTRAQALTWLKAEFADAVLDIGWTFTSSADEGNFAAVIDNALRALGVAETDLATYDVPQDDIPDFLILMTYFALRAIVRALGLRVDVEADDPRTKVARSQAWKAYKALLDDATKEAKDLLKPGMEYGNLVLDIYEPTPVY